MHRITRILLLLVLLATGAHARQAARDGGFVPSGTAMINGVVFDNQAQPKPLRRAVVTVSGAHLAAPRSAITDDDGWFQIRQLSAGRVTIAAVKPGYVSGAYGATRPGRPGTPVELRDAESFNVKITLARAAALTGIIRSQSGEPLAGMRVFALIGTSPTAPSPAGREFDDGITALTDERGMYRLYNLAPGDYVIAVVPTASINGDVFRRSVDDTDAILARLKQRQSSPRLGPASLPPSSLGPATLAPRFYPGTAALRHAGRVTVESGEVRGGLDIIWTPVPTTTIEGMVVGGGPLPASVQLSISSADTVRFFLLGGATPQLVQSPGPDGRFKYQSIVPGRYTISARASASVPPLGREGGAAPPVGDTQYAIEEIDVTGEPLSGVTLRLQRGSRVSGRIVFDAEKQKPVDPALLRISVRAPATRSTGTVGDTVVGNTFAQPANVTPTSDGTFVFESLPPGTYTVSVVVPPTVGSWWFRSAVKGERELLDTGLRLSPGEDQTELVLTLTDRHSEISGTLQTAAGLPAAAYVIVAMPTDASLWTSGPRRIKSTWPATDGGFSVVDLPAGEYVLIALTDLEPADLDKTDFLRSIAPAGIRVALGVGEKKRQDIKISR